MSQVKSFFTGFHFKTPSSDGIREWLVILIYGFVVFLTAYFLTFYSYSTTLPRLEVGSVAPENITAPKTITYTDIDKTNQLRQAVSDATQSIYKFSPQKQTEVLNNFEILFGKIENTLSSSAKEQEKLSQLTLDFNGNEDLAKTLLKTPKDDIVTMENLLSTTASSLFINGVRSDTLSQSLNAGIEKIKQSKLPTDEQAVTIYIFKQFMQPNLIFDSDATEKAKQDAMKAVPPVRVTIQQGTIVVNKGDTITQDDIDLLNTLGIIRGSDFWRNILLFMLAVSGFVLISISSLRKFIHNRPISFTKKILELLIVVLITYVTLYLTKNVSYYLIPIPLFAMIIFEFTDFATMLVLTVALSFVVSFSIEMPSFVLVSMLAALILNIYALKKTNKIVSFIYASILAALFFGIASFAYSIITKEVFSTCAVNFLYSFANFFVSAIASIGIVFIMEHLFNEITIMRLLELSDTNNQLMKELLIKAPGTYQHSMLVANIASNAAEAIGADSLLTKVGGYYHDIGKMNHPYFFTENQSGIPNIHNTLSPNLSKSVIINHVKDGVAIAKQFRLPKEIIDFIETHHGKTVVTYFYHKAKEVDPSVSKDDYRYPGPLPQTKETAILFFADAVEAAAHSLEEVDFRKIEELVNTIVDERVNDGQLDESAITFSELRTIKDSLVKSIVSIYHRREKYPNEQESVNNSN
ncbi:MAG: HD family phosphohydrolase [Caldisericaceae bacterium]